MNDERKDFHELHGVPDENSVGPVPRERLPGNEIYLDGGVYFEGTEDELTRQPERTDLMVQKVGTGEEGNPYSFNLHVITGNSTYCWVGILPEDLARIGKFLVDEAEG